MSIILIIIIKSVEFFLLMYIYKYIFGFLCAFSELITHACREPTVLTPKLEIILIFTIYYLNLHPYYSKLYPLTNPSCVSHTDVSKAPIITGTGSVAKSSANGLVGTGFASQYRFTQTHTHMFLFN